MGLMMEFPVSVLSQVPGNLIGPKGTLAIHLDGRQVYGGCSGLGENLFCSVSLSRFPKVSDKIMYYCYNQEKIIYIFVFSSLKR